MKSVGRRRSRPHPKPDELEAFLQMGIAMRKTPCLVPRGVCRFKTFEEAQEWMDRNILETLKKKAPTHVPPPSTI